MIKKNFFFIAFVSMTLIYIIFQNEFIGNIARNEIRWYLLENRIQFTHVNYSEFTKSQFKANYSIDVNINSKYNIFFVETNQERLVFSNKELCAIESAAVKNPDSAVYIFAISAKFDKLDLRSVYPNIIYKKLDPVELFSKTPLALWWKSGNLEYSKFRTAHLADAARLALLWKYGGFYSDLDTISLKIFEPLNIYSGFGFLTEVPNEKGVEESSLGNGFMHFPLKHPFIAQLMFEFVSNYNPFVWGSNGPVRVIETLKTYCKFSQPYSKFYTNLMLDVEEGHAGKDRCNITIFPENYCYPFKYYNSEPNLIFAENGEKEVSRLMNTYSLHLYGKFSNSLKIRNNSVYEFFSKQYCKATFGF